jgi:holo-[acyl-carrier protein] synthase
LFNNPLKLKLLIIGVGTDIFEINRMKKRIEKEPDFIQSVFTSQEISYCEQFKFKEQNYAARFAAKEAVMKALGTGYNKGISFSEIVISNNVEGKPEIILTGKTLERAVSLGVTDIHVSLSHSKKQAVAFVILSSYK